MILEFKKRKRSILERIFIYPSFTLRFWLYAIILFLAIGIPSLIIIPYIDNSADKLSSINIALQTVTLVFGIVATYFALKQLTESRFSNLDELGRQDAKEKKYFRAINNWREALYIRPDSNVFFNLLELLLISEEFEEFDLLTGYLEKSEMFHRSFQQAILTEPQDCIIFYYLQTFRNLSVENMGAAKEHLKCMMQLIKNHKFHSHIGWDFSDMKSGSPYQKLTGEHKVVADNLIRYLTRQMTPVERTEFENENYLLTPPNDQNPLS